MSMLINVADVLFIVVLTCCAMIYNTQIRPYLSAIKWAKLKRRGLSLIE